MSLLVSMVLLYMWLSQYVVTIGVLVTKDLSPSMHVNDVVSKAHKRAGAMLRTFVSCDVNLLMRAFVTYVRPC